PSHAGRLVERVPTALGTYHVMMVEAAPGEQIEAEELSADQSETWGAALAGMHRLTGTTPHPRTMPVDLRQTVFPDDPELATAIMALADHLDTLPRDAAHFGLTHGDFELDNLAWQDQTITAFDFDEAGLSWFAADIAAATEDIRSDAALYDAFIRG